ncbi:MAG: hypothetical protein IPI49_28615 [Myxococcales bacterium]|nr:hypothetical protein [Myxococcales bacterium]
MLSIGSPAHERVPASTEEHLYERIAADLDDAVASRLITAMVHAHWLIGREIVEVDQPSAERSGWAKA